METQQDFAGEIEVDETQQQQEPQDEGQDFDASDLYPEEGTGQDEAQEADQDAEGDTGDEYGQEPKPDPIDAPHSWSKEDKAVFGKLDPAVYASLPPDEQASVLSQVRDITNRREAERDRFVQQKSVEAAQTRNQVANEARDIIAKMHEDHAQKLAVYAQQFTVQPPDQRLLYSQNPDDVMSYHRQRAAYEASVDQQQQLHQQISQAQAAANAAREQSQQAEIASDAQRLQEQLPEWFDPSSGPKLREQLQSIGAELGYPAELMAQASSSDIIALKKASEWKAKAEKFDALMSKKMKDVRSHRQPPKIARPGNGAAPAAAVDPVKILYPND